VSLDDHDDDDDDDDDDVDVDVDEGTMVEAVILVSEYSCNRRNDTPFFFSETRS
jgi:major membrane immunogen (membrane-anchored lipoprotein)